MKLNKIFIKNFLSFQKAEIELNSLGLVLISGNNLDASSAESNGSGKSTIAEALVWVLFGQTFRGLTGDEVLNNKIKRDCEVTVDFENDGVKGQIRRFRKLKKYGDGLSLRLDGEDVTKSSVKETQALINSLLGVDFSTFSNLVSFPQGAARYFASLTDKEQKGILEKALGLEKLTEYLMRTKEILNGRRSKLDETIYKLSQIEGQIDATQSRLRDLEFKQSNFEELKSSRIESTKINIATIDSQLLKSKSDNILKLKSKVDTLKRSLANVDKSKLEERVDSTKEKLARYSEKIYQFSSQRDKVQKKLKNLKSLVGKEKCPYCGQLLTEENLDKHKRELSAELVELESEIKKEHTAETKMEGVLEELEKKVDKVELLESDLSLTEKELSNEEWKERNERTELETKKKMLEKELVKIRAELSPYLELINKEKEALINFKTELEKLKSFKQKVESDVKYLEFWEVGFSNKGLKSYILDNVINVLNERANFYSSKLTNGEIQINFHTQSRLKGGGVREKFGVDVEVPNGTNLYKGTSGGERRRADLAILLALRYLVTKRSEKQFNFLIADEILDALDAPGVEKAVEVLKDEVGEDGTIFLISHRPELLDAESYDRNIVVQKKDGISRVIKTTNQLLP